MEEIKKLMDDEIISQIKGLSALQSGSKEQTEAVKNLTALYEARVNEKKIELDAEDKREKREMEREQHQADEALKKSQAADEAAVKDRELTFKETQATKDAEIKDRELKLKEAQAADEAAARERELQLKEAQLDDQKIDRLVRAGIAMVEIGLPLVCYGHWFRKGLKFEETGSITSSMMRNLINKFKTKK